MFDYQEIQQIKSIMIDVLKEYGLIKTEEVKNTKSPVTIKKENNEDLKMTDEEERLYQEYLYA
ncbi:MAG: hypothetical protein IJ638_04440, partial [Alphaproteobacteria bacterium]|nr:hypothetical protein [Alphaproteobacteria bacterium]